MSRPTMLDSKLINTICSHIEKGCSNADAAILSGISESVFYNWKKLGREHEEEGYSSIYVELLERLKESEVKFKAYHIDQIAKASKNPKHWTASAWLLERKYNDEFGRKDKLHVKGNLNHVNFDVQLSPEEQEAYKKRMKDMYGDEFTDE